MQESLEANIQTNISAGGKKKLVFFCAGAAVLVLLLLYFFWWPLPADQAYRFVMKDSALALTIVGDKKEEAAARYELAALSNIKAARASRSLKQNPIVWESNNPAVATVDENGLIRAEGKGEALVTGRLGSLSQTVAVTVSYPLQGIAFSDMPQQIIKGQEQTLSVQAIPEQAELPESIEFSSSSPENITIDGAGRIRGVSVGSAVLMAKGAGFEGGVKVAVLSPMTGIHIQRLHRKINIGEQVSLFVSFQPADTTDEKNVSWESSDQTVASVNEAGVLTAHKPGKTVIRAVCGTHRAEREIEIFARLKGISFQEEKHYLLKDEEITPLLRYEPENTTDDKKAVYSSSDEKIASVDEEGLVTALKAGETVITAQVGDFSAQTVVIVRVPMTGIAFEEGGRSLSRGSRMTLPVLYFPADTNDDRSLSWESSDPSVMSVKDGELTALKAGRATITARCGEFAASADFNVVVPVSAVEISRSSLSLNKGETASVKAWVLPEDTTEEKSIRFSSSNPAVASVDERGNIRAAGVGSCRITASHGGFSAACELRVLSPMTGISLNQTQLRLLEGKTAQLSVSFIPWDTTDSRHVSWSSSNTAVGQVDGNGVVRAAGAGDCVITARAGSFSASASLHVDPFIHVASVTLSPGTAHFTSRGETLKLNAAVLPANATAPAVTFSSSNPSVVSVSGDGVLTALSSGQSVITAKAENATASVTVTAELPAPPKVVVLDPGHGGAFTGAVFGGRSEKHLNLRVALHCKAYLEANYQNVAVYLTRGDDRSLSSNLRDDLIARAAVGKNLGADILISLHFNASIDHSASGVIAYHSFAASVAGQSKRLAELLVNKVSALGLSNHGVTYRYYDETGRDPSLGDWYGIVRHSASHGIPAVLMEHCCMDHDISFVDSDEDLYRFGVQDALAIAEYLGLERK